MNAAWWTLAGVGIASGFNLARDRLLEDRRTLLQWRKEREDELRAARVACLLISDELDTHALNFGQLAKLGRMPKRPVAQTPNFLASSEWEAHKRDLARLTIIPVETWTGLTHAYHNAQQVRARVEIDGPEAPFPPERIPTLKDHSEAAKELAAILTDAAEKIADRLKPLPRGWARLRLRTRLVKEDDDDA